MSTISEKEWIEDFQEFVQGRGTTVPEGVSKAILARVQRDLNPSPWLVFLKLLGVHSVVGTLSLALCNQFEMSPFKTGFSLSDYFIKFGHSTCMVLCGVLFVGLSVMACKVIVRPEEFAVLRRNAWLQVFGLSMVSLGVFAVVGAEIVLTMAVLWLIGAMLGGVSITLLLRRQDLRSV